jgi:hypothetical protein
MEVGSSNHQVLNMMKMLNLSGAYPLMKGSFRDNLKVPNRRRLFKHVRERRPNIWNIPREQGSLNHPPRRRNLLRRKLRRSSPKNPSLRCREKTRRYRNSSHASSEVNLITTLRNLWRLCVDLASTCHYWMPFKFLHIIVTSKKSLQINMR